MNFKEEVKKKYYEYKLQNNLTNVQLAELIGINQATLVKTITKGTTLEKNWYKINNFLESQGVNIVTETKEIVENVQNGKYDSEKITVECNLGKLEMNFKDAMEIAITTFEALGIRTPEVDVLINKVDDEYNLELF